jgi:hypothetical protein
MKQQVFFASFFMIFFFATQQGLAQPYESAVGVRLGYPTSVSYKFHVNETSAIEAYGGARWFSGYSWYNISAAYQVHSPLDIEGLDGLRWYYGGGASIFFWSFSTGFRNGNYASTSFGLQGYLGLEYNFEDLPINLTVDWVPTLFINGFSSGFGGGYGTLGVRYILSE